MYVNVFLSAHVHDGIQGSGKVIYECPMHPEIQSDKPDDCSICGMALVEKPRAPAGSVLAVPRNAVLDTGERKLVYIEKEKGVYVPKEIEVGPDAIAGKFPDRFSEPDHRTGRSDLLWSTRER
jgi:hypothetical protein